MCESRTVALESWTYGIVVGRSPKAKRWGAFPPRLPGGARIGRVTEGRRMGTIRRPWLEGVEPELKPAIKSVHAETFDILSGISNRCERLLRVGIPKTPALFICTPSDCWRDVEAVVLRLAPELAVSLRSSESSQDSVKLISTLDALWSRCLTSASLDVFDRLIPIGRNRNLREASNLRWAARLAKIIMQSHRPHTRKWLKPAIADGLCAYAGSVQSVSSKYERAYQQEIDSHLQILLEQVQTRTSRRKEQSSDKKPGPKRDPRKRDFDDIAGLLWRQSLDMWGGGEVKDEQLLEIANVLDMAFLPASDYIECRETVRSVKAQNSKRARKNGRKPILTWTQWVTDFSDERSGFRDLGRSERIRAVKKTLNRCASKLKSDPHTASLILPN
jgi:hypothetical protein